MKLNKIKKSIVSVIKWKPDLPENWSVVVLKDWSGGFWRKMQKEYNNLEIICHKRENQKK